MRFVEGGLKSVKFTRHNRRLKMTCLGVCRRRNTPQLVLAIAMPFLQVGISQASLLHNTEVHCLSPGKMSC